MNRPDVSKFKDNTEVLLALRTANITQKDRDLIGVRLAPKRMAEHDGGYGTFFDCSVMDDVDLEDLKEYGFSEHFIKIMQDAHDYGFDRVYFDCDASELPDEYPTFDDNNE